MRRVFICRRLGTRFEVQVLSCFGLSFIVRFGRYWQVVAIAGPVVLQFGAN